MKAFAVGERKYWSSASKKAFLPSLAERLVDVHPGAVLAEQRLRHEGRVPAVLHRVLLDDDAVGHAVVGHLERVLVAHVDLVLGGADLVVGVLDVDAHLLQRQDGVAAHVGAGVERGQVEVAALVEDLGHAALGFGRAEVEVLELGADVVGVEARSPRPVSAPAAGSSAGRPRRARRRGPGCRRTSARRRSRSSGRQGIRAKVEGSGIAIMSDSSIGLKPVIEEPSKPMPPSKASSSSAALIEKLFSWPRTSVNQRRTKRTSFSLTIAATSAALFGCSAIPASLALARRWSGNDRRSEPLRCEAA